MQINYIEVIINVTLATFGGIVKRLSDLEKRPVQKVSLSYYFIGSCISMFAGIVVYFLCKYFNLSPFLTAGLTALSGYIGAPTLDLLSHIIMKRVEKEAGENET